jgi:hypothetical protein
LAEALGRWPDDPASALSWLAETYGVERVYVSPWELSRLSASGWLDPQLEMGDEPQGVLGVLLRHAALEQSFGVRGVDGARVPTGYVFGLPRP